MRTRWIPRIGVVVLFALVLVPLDTRTRAASPDDTQRSPFLWKIEGNGPPTYLYGTIHVPDPRVTELPSAVKAAFGASQAVFTEIRMDSADRASGYFTTRSDRDPELYARTSGVYWRADPDDAAIMDGRDDHKRAALIAERLTQWRAVRSA